MRILLAALISIKISLMVDMKHLFVSRFMFTKQIHLIYILHFVA